MAFLDTSEDECTDPQGHQDHRSTVPLHTLWVLLEKLIAAQRGVFVRSVFESQKPISFQSPIQAGLPILFGTVQRSVILDDVLEAPHEDDAAFDADCGKQGDPKHELQRQGQRDRQRWLEILPEPGTRMPYHSH
ncbi:hypothetical protein QUB80_05095 [Chlorogloeopsis sp. ULAP01]|uniref:hypothetical protein n=1 Tax=Chlorogloeopsis sp. ULAP01 TaxID=3056483 RepID=UPI0025AA42BD|nr:hypothetical protein [Chlorogloeopsis sp. ULAP01]MDM9380075.1 hypothetical protein [Chlorogloeopsis sp. ULAP01]